MSTWPAAIVIPRAEERMTCVFCKVGETESRRVTVERHDEAGEPIAVIHNFPAEVCRNCGEEYYAASDWARVEKLLGQAPLRVAEVPVYQLEGR